MPSSTHRPRTHKNHPKDPSAKAPTVRPLVTGTLENLEHFRSQAERVDARDVIVCRFDLAIAQHNCGALVRALERHRAEVTELLASAVGAKILGKTISPDDLFSLPQLAEATAYAATQEPPEGPNAALQDLLPKASASRSLLLDGARALRHRHEAIAKALPDIEANSGKLDIANDCIALAALFGTHWATIHDQTPVTEADVRTADERGRGLRGMIKPKGGVDSADAAPDANAWADLRDRLWTLQVQRFDIADRIAGLFPDLDATYAPLRSRARAPSGAGAEKEASTAESDAAKGSTEPTDVKP
jgi:hypothetical protein